MAAYQSAHPDTAAQTNSIQSQTAATAPQHPPPAYTPHPISGTKTSISHLPSQSTTKKLTINAPTVICGTGTGVNDASSVQQLRSSLCFLHALLSRPETSSLLAERHIEINCGVTVVGRNHTATATANVPKYAATLITKSQQLRSVPAIGNDTVRKTQLNSNLASNEPLKCQTTTEQIQAGNDASSGTTNAVVGVMSGPNHGGDDRSAIHTLKTRPQVPLAARSPPRFQDNARLNQVIMQTSRQVLTRNASRTSAITSSKSRPQNISTTTRGNLDMRRMTRSISGVSHQYINSSTRVTRSWLKEAKVRDSELFFSLFYPYKC